MTLVAQCLVVLLGMPAAADSASPALTAAGPRPGPVSIVEVAVPDRDAQLKLLDGEYDVSNVRGDVITIYATGEELRRLEQSGFQVTAVGGRQGAAPLGSAAKELGVYHSYAGLTNALNAYATEYTALCRLYSLGQSVQGRELWAMLITDAPDVEEDEPEFKYVSTMHGDEPLGTETCLYFIDRLLVDYGADSRITDLVDSTEIWVVPLMNPDGLELGSRYNADGYDLNRSFPAYPGDFTGTSYDGEPLGDAARPPEVAYIMRWSAENSFVLSANFHTGALVVNYPYDDDGKPSYTDAPTPDDLLFEDIARRYSIHNAPMWNNWSFQDGITNGCLWYSISGGMQDWNYRYLSCNEVTIELSNTKQPLESSIPSFWADNEESMLSYMGAVHIGVRGIVADGQTGEPLWSKVLVDGNPHPVFTDPDVGDYYRMLLPGTYDLVISARGYVSQTMRSITVSEETATRVDVELLDPDIDNDGLVGAADVQLVVNAILGYHVSHPCDLDGGGLSATDLQTLINIVLGQR